MALQHLCLVGTRPGDPALSCEQRARRGNRRRLAVFAGVFLHTQGGLEIDDRCRVLDGEGRPLPRLWAAGGAARGVSGNAVRGYLSGDGLHSGVAGGWIAANSIRHFLATSTS